MIKKYLTLLLLVALATFAGSFVTPVLAAVTCTTQYGGGQTCATTGQLLINKKVFDPDLKTFVDNSTHRFSLGQEVTFTIETKNVGDATLNNITVTDTLPVFLTWVSGDSLVSIIDSLAPGQSITKTIKAKVNSNGIVCDPNMVVASGNGMSDQDSAQVCIAGPVPPVMPKAGPEYLALLLPLTGIGFYLKRFNLKGVKS